MSNNPIIKCAGAVALAGTLASTAVADDSALIDILQRKGILSQKEATSLRQELNRGENSASKMKLSSAVSELKLYGDIRFRYQFDEQDSQLPPSQGGGANLSQNSRMRFRLRLNADFKLGEHAFGGVELQSNNASDSGNQTYQNGFSDYEIFISKAFLGWHPNEWFTVTAGKMANPFYATELIWDSDINPTGVTEVIDFHKLVGLEPSRDYAKDGKETKDIQPAERAWQLSLVAGQFIFDDNPEFNGPDYDSSTDAYLVETQLIGSYKFGGTKVTLAPAWLTYINGSASGLVNGTKFEDSALVSGATRNLNLLLAPGDIRFEMGGLKTKVYWDFSYNIDGKKRVQDTYRLANNVGNPQHTTEDDFAYLIGFQVGENRKQGDWSLLVNWRQVGLGAVDPNLNDSDYAQSELNVRGVKGVVGYNFSDFAVGTVTYGYAWNLRDSLFGGEATGGNTVAGANVAKVLLLEFMVKF